MEVDLENISKLLGKPVINIYDGNLEGYVKNVLVDANLKKVVWAEIFDDNTQEDTILSFKDIFCLNNDAIMIKNNSGVLIAETVDTLCINPIGYKIYSLDGKYEDKVLDIVFDEKYKITKILLTDNRVLEHENILKIGNGIIIKKENRHVNISAFRPKTMINTAIQTEQTVETLDNKKPLSSNPKKLLATGFEFLIGRKVGQNIYSENKQLIIKKQSKITPHIINLASQNGKLKELTTYSII